MSKIKTLGKKKEKDVRAGFCPFCDRKLKIKLYYRICYNCNKVYKLYENKKWKAIGFKIVLTNKQPKRIGQEKYFLN